jgi:hypothetical protein
MSLAFALAFAAAALVELSGHLFKLNKNFVAGARTVIIMGGLWFAVKASREPATPKRPSSQSEIRLGYLPSQQHGFASSLFAQTRQPS